MVNGAGYRSLRVERRGVVGWLLFNRPEARNAMNVEMHDELPLAWAALERDPAVRVLVCSGAGPHFSSGVDLVDLADCERSGVFRRDVEHPESARFTARDCGVTKPVVAAVNGMCVGGAFMWVVDADVAIAAEDGLFVDPHTSVGQTVGRGTLSLVGNAPFSAVMRMTLLGRHERITARRALELGIVSEVVAPHDLHRAAQRLATTIARSLPARVARAKAAMWRLRQRGLDDGCRGVTHQLADELA
jgi:enoyl-CoA hydratase/carnithine racemase